MLSHEGALARVDALLADAMMGKQRSVREMMADALLAAQAEARSRFLGASMTPEALAHVARNVEAARNGDSGAALWTVAYERDVSALLAHSAYLESVLGDLREDGALDPYLKGRQAGQQEMAATLRRTYRALVWLWHLAEDVPRWPGGDTARETEEALAEARRVLVEAGADPYEEVDDHQGAAP